MSKPGCILHPPPLIATQDHSATFTRRIVNHIEKNFMTEINWRKMKFSRKMKQRNEFYEFEWSESGYQPKL